MPGSSSYSSNARAALILIAFLLLSVSAACAGTTGEASQEPAANAADNAKNEAGPSAGGGSKGPKPARSDVKSCEDLASLDLEELPGAPTRISSAEIVDATDKLPEHCRVRGYVSPKVRFELQLPTRGDWNGNFLFGGCGGLCGTVNPTNCGDALPRGYVAATTDSGHEGVGPFEGGEGGENLDALWAYGDEAAVTDFTHRGVHVSTIATKEIAKTYYGDEIRYSYFVGCSQGGRQAMVEAQRYPEDFDGILAIDPGLDFRAVQLDWTWQTNVNRDDEGKRVIRVGDIPLIQKAVMDSCDAVDGLKDGLIGDPRRCDFDPASLKCEEGESRNCLTEQQIGVLRRLYGPPTDSQGEPLTTGGLLPGSEGSWAESIIGSEEQPAFTAEILGDEMLQYLSFDEPPGPGYDPRSFDFDTDPAKMQRKFDLISANDPDLSAFRDAGGKLMLWRSWADADLSPAATISYYDRVVDSMGGSEATQEFFRLFMVPGKSHCEDEPFGAPPEALTLLEDWVERGVAPDRATVEYPNGDGEVTRTRPVFPYPLVARYDGSGSIDKASNFEPAQPE